MEQFKDEDEMLVELDHFIFKCKGLKNNQLKIRLIQKINDFLYENNLFSGTDGDLVKHKKKEK